MKKLFSIILAVMVFALAACGGGSESTGSQSDGSKFAFKTGNITVKMNADAENVIANLGEPKSYFESESCAFKGLDKQYTYASFVVATYPKDDKDYISSVTLLDDTVATAEGIRIGSTVQEIDTAYGSNFTALTGESRSYVDGDAELQLIVTGGLVSSIAYYAKTGVN